MTRHDLSPCPPQFVALAQRLADAAGPITRRYFRAAPAVEDKDDSTPVTVADREAEAAMRAIIEAEYPDHGIIGEEMDDLRPDAEFVWVLDPIDGTQSFITGKPLFGTLIGLARGGAPILGVIDQSILGERWTGAAGRATTFNGEEIHTRDCARLTDAWLDATSPEIFGGGDDWAAFKRLRDDVKHPGYGADCYAYGLLASGFIDLVAEAGLKPFDFTALAPIIEGAGGKITDWAGARLTLKSDGRVLAAGDARCHRAALDRLGAGVTTE